MCRKIYLAATAAILATSLYAQSGKAITREEYINTYAELAMKEMIRTGIPASITLAQGCLESDNGNSRLAVKANNHFGIKCHEWDGPKVNHDDDRRNECFRKYKSPYESYMDHSEFLTSKSRYEFLFEYNPDDYRQWAKGLKKAGYATSPQYADLLIKIIEDNQLYKYDQTVMAGGDLKPGKKQPGSVKSGREILKKNRIEYIIVQAGDTPESLRNELDLYRNELIKYNDLDESDDLKPGQPLYLQPKRRKAEQGDDVHIVAEGETMRDISQKYGVRMKDLYRMNRMDEGQYLLPGTKISLRKKKRDPILQIEPEQEVPQQEMIFEFEN